MADFFAQYGVLILALAGCGIVSGVAAGLFGIGGGAIIVPVLIILFEGLGFSDSASHVAIATSLATIILTSARSVMAHHKRGAVDWQIIRTWAPWIMIGAFAGQLVAGQMSAAALKAFFGAMAYLLAAQLFFGRPGWRLADDMPTGPARAGFWHRGRCPFGANGHWRWNIWRQLDDRLRAGHPSGRCNRSRVRNRDWIAERHHSDIRGVGTGRIAAIFNWLRQRRGVRTDFRIHGDHGPRRRPFGAQA